MNNSLSRHINSAISSLSSSKTSGKRPARDTPDLIYAVEPSATIIFSSQSVISYLQFLQEDVVGTNLQDMLFHEDRKLILDRIKSHKAFVAHVRFINKQGNLVRLKVRGKPFDSQEHPAGQTASDNPVHASKEAHPSRFFVLVARSASSKAAASAETNSRVKDGFCIPITNPTDAYLIRSGSSINPQSSNDPAVPIFKVDASIVRLSYKYSHIQRIVQLQHDISTTRNETAEIVSQSNALVHIIEARESASLESQRLRNRIRQIEKTIMEQTQNMQTTHLKLKEIRSAITARRTWLEQHRSAFDDNSRSFIRARDGLALTRREMHRTLCKCARRRQQLIHNLHDLFPLSTTNDDRFMTIRGLVLPNSNFSGQDDDKISTALGFVVHYLLLISYYLDIPLRYYMLPMSSRATVWDVVSQQFHGSKEFPLYLRGMDRIRFDYAVFLVNKNVEQVLSETGRPVRNLRNMLPNLRDIVSAVNAWRTSSHDQDDDDIDNVYIDGAHDWDGVRGASVSAPSVSAASMSVASAGQPLL